MKLSHVNWICTSNADKLRRVGISTTDDLLRHGKTEVQRARLASKVGVTRSKVLRWVHSADLSRVRGIRDDYVSMMNRAKVYTPDDLAAQDAEGLVDQFLSLNRVYHIVKRVPAPHTVSRWIVSAQELPRLVKYRD